MKVFGGRRYVASMLHGGFRSAAIGPGFRAAAFGPRLGQNAGVGIRTTAPAVIQRATTKQHEYQQLATGSETHLPHPSTYLRTKTGCCVSETRPMARKFCLVASRNLAVGRVCSGVSL